MKSGDENKEYLIALDRSNLSITVRSFASLQLYPPDGYSNHVLTCQTIEDQEIFGILKAAYESTYAEALEKKRQYDNRPNKI